LYQGGILIVVRIEDQGKTDTIEMAQGMCYPLSFPPPTPQSFAMQQDKKKTYLYKNDLKKKL